MIFSIIISYNAGQQPYTLDSHGLQHAVVCYVAKLGYWKTIFNLQGAYGEVNQYLAFNS
jgi:hypothetical protein